MHAAQPMASQGTHDLEDDENRRGLRGRGVTKKGMQYRFKGRRNTEGDEREQGWTHGAQERNDMRRVFQFLSRN